MIDLDAPLDVLQKHGHQASWGHILWVIFFVFPKQAWELAIKARDAVLFWKEIKQEEEKHMNIVSLFKEIEEAPAIVAAVETIIKDGEELITNDPQVQKLKADVLALKNLILAAVSKGTDTAPAAGTPGTAGAAS